MKLNTGVAAAGLVAMVMAQSHTNTTVEVPEIGLDEPFFPPDAYFASVVAANEKATTYHLQCGKSLSRCPLPMPATYINGPYTVNLKLAYNLTVSATVMRTTVSNDCQITPSASASCNLRRDGYLLVTDTSHTPTVSKRTTTGTYHSPLSTAVLTITAGKEKLSSTFGQAGSSTTGTSSGMGTSVTAGQAGSSTTETSSGMGAAATVGAGSGVGIAVVGIAAAVFL